MFLWSYRNTAFSVRLLSECLSNNDHFYFYKLEAPDSVAVGGFTILRLARNDYYYVQASFKPTSMVLRLLDKLLSKQTLLKSTLYGTKEFAALDSNKIASIKGKLGKKNSYHSHTQMFS